MWTIEQVAFGDAYFAPLHSPIYLVHGELRTCRGSPRDAAVSH